MIKEAGSDNQYDTDRQIQLAICLKKRRRTVRRVEREIKTGIAGTTKAKS